VRRRGLRALLPAALAVVACAHVEAFRADPVTVCAGDAVRVVWEAEQGAVRLDSDPELPGTGASADAGSQVFTLRTDTRFTLLVDGLFRDDHAEADVVVTPEEGEQGYGEVATCDEAARAIHTTVRLSHQVSPLLRVEQVRNLHDRPLVVEKGGRRAELASLGQSDALAELPVQGAWRLRSPLAPTETCEEALRSVRQRLGVEIRFRCRC